MNKEQFVGYCKQINIIINEEMYNKLYLYFKLLEKWNNMFNLTTIISEEGVFLKHFYDSLLLSKYVNLNKALSLCDFGTGAGFPGLVLAIVFNNLNVTLIESSNKKCTFLNEVVKDLELKNVIIINERAEIYSKVNREKYDIVTCRAVSALKVISELALPMLKVNGIFAPLKANTDEEIKDTSYILNELSSTIEKIETYNLPIENAKRSVIIIKKNKITSSKYPREYNKIIK